jgi:hypothetical protein
MLTSAKAEVKTVKTKPGVPEAMIGDELVLVTGAEIEEYLVRLKDEDQALARFIINHRFKGKILPEGLYLNNEWEQVKELINYLVKLV